MAKFQVTRTLRATKANPGIRSAYRKQIEAMMQELRDDVQARILELYDDLEWRIDPNYAEDAWFSPAERFIKMLAPVIDRWTKRASKAAESIANRFVGSVTKGVENSRRQSLKDAGILTKIVRSHRTKEAYKALVFENVQLITSIPKEYLDGVRYKVLDCISRGADREALQKDLQYSYGLSEKKARTIANDQINKATQAMAQATDRDLGITEGIWVHVPGQFSSRPTHVAMDGKKFPLSEGLYDENKYVMKKVKPGELINCIPGSTEINCSSTIDKIFRRWYSGKLTALVTDDGAVTFSTPNHPILSPAGWLPADALDVGNYIVKKIEQGINGISTNQNNRVPTIQNLFDALSFKNESTLIFAGSNSQFHGDGSDANVDVIDVHRLLSNIGNTLFVEAATKFGFSGAEVRLIPAFLSGNCPMDFVFDSVLPASDGGMSGFCNRLSKFLCGLSNPQRISLLATSYMYTSINEPTSNNLTATTKLFSDCIFGFTCFIQGYDFVARNIQKHTWTASVNRDNASQFPDFSTNNAFVVPDFSGNVLEIPPRGYLFRRIIKKFSRDFTGHIYNLQTKTGSYIAQNTVMHNCRCTYRAVLQDKWGKSTPD